MTQKALLESRIELCKKLISDHKQKGKDVKQLEKVMEYWKRLKDEYFSV